MIKKLLRARISFLYFVFHYRDTRRGGTRPWTPCRMILEGFYSPAVLIYSTCEGKCSRPWNVSRWHKRRPSETFFVLAFWYNDTKNAFTSNCTFKTDCAWLIPIQPNQFIKNVWMNLSPSITWSKSVFGQAARHPGDCPLSLMFVLFYSLYRLLFYLDFLNPDEILSNAVANNMALTPECLQCEQTEASTVTHAWKY